MAAQTQVPGQVHHLPPTENTNSDENNETSVNSSTNNSDSENPQDSTTNSNLNNKTFYFKTRMLNLFKEIAIVLLVAVTYAALTNDYPPKVSKSPAAYPFFSKSSIVSDWYKGEVTKAIEQARTSDIAFVMFYAPWDAESQTARSEFEGAANYLKKIVTFAAVNCWQPGGECKKQYSKVYNWPVLIAYPTHGRGVQYNGPLKSAHMIKFLQNVCKPLVSPQNVNDLISKHDAVVMGNLDALPGSVEFAVYYTTALRFLEKDPFQDVAFAILPQNKRNTPRITLYIWNETIFYNGEWNSEVLLTWILKNYYQITSWITPTGSKSLSLSNTIQPGPSLILFTPRNPFSEDNDIYNMLKQIAYEYSNCNNSYVSTLKQRLIQMRRLKNRLHHRDLKSRCHDNSRSTNHKKIIPQSVKIWANVTIPNCLDSCDGFEHDFCLSTTNGRQYKMSLLGDEDDPRSPRSLEKLWKDEECRNYLAGEKYHPPVFAQSQDSGGFNISGISCRNNRSLAFVAMDSLHYYHFAEKLGLNLFSVEDMTGALIINDEMETHHILKGPLTDSNLRHFILNFTRGSLPRALHSNPQLESKNTHIYPQITCTTNVSDDSKHQFCVPELDSNTFLPTVLKPTKAVLVFYYSRQCAFCKGVAFKFLTVAKMLSNVTDLLFTRIDGDLNLLTWQYTIESYPTILFFPPNRKSESRAFPRNLPVTVPNLIGFILTNVMDPGLKIQIMWAICNNTQSRSEDVDCVSSIRMEILAVINSSLKKWRNVDSLSKLEVLRKLQILRHLHLLFVNHTPGKHSQIQYQLNKLKVFDISKP